MIFLLDKKDREEINKLIETYEYNNQVADYLNANVINETINEEDIDEYKIEHLNINNYINDKYYKNIKLEEVKTGQYQIKYEHYKPNQAFLYDDIEVDENDYFLIKNKIGYFTDKFIYPTIQKNDVIWMGVFPHEINTMNRCKMNIMGHVYIFGLGLAYFPYSYCDNASKITIIDNDPTIIEVFKKYILPHFENKDKYEIICSDAFDYIPKINKDDYIFVDLWHNVNDGFKIYYKLKKSLKDYKNVTYWIEDSLIACFRNIIINLINEELNQPGLDYKRADNFIDELTNKLHYHFEKKKISSYLEIKELLSKDSLKKLISEI